MKKIIFGLMMAVAAVMLMPSCTTSKQILYFQDIDTINLKPLTNDYEAIIKKDDRLTIVVSGPDKQVCAPYNLTLGDYGRSGGAGFTSANPENATLTYLVDPNGDINFPTLGKIHVEGMTRNQLVEYLQEEIGKDVKDPIVYVSFKNYKVTVLGEVRSPGVKIFDNEKVTILQALGAAGDLALTAKREGILLLREENGKTVHYAIDLKSADLMQQPYFYMQQNDVLYVPASANRVMQANNGLNFVSFGVSMTTSAISLATAIWAIVDRTKK